MSILKTSSLVFAVVSFGLLLAVALVSPVLGQVQTHGQWQTAGYQLPINPIHVALMHDGKILIIAGSGNNAQNFGRGILKSMVLDPQSGNYPPPQTQQWDMFCNGMTVLPDGRVFVAGGNLAYSPFLGDKHSAVFDPLTERFADLQSMPRGRWYPTTITLNDGRVFVFGGTDDNNNSNNTVAFYTVGQGWSQDYGAPFTPPLYPRLHQLPDGTMFYSGPTADSHFFDPNTHTWTLGVAHTNYGNLRIYGSSVLLPLRPADNYRARVMILGGGDRISATTASTEIIDLSTGTNWVTKAPMSQARIEMNAVILPTGKVLALGGSSIDEDGTSASLAADLYDPATDTFSSAGTAAFPRLYHSVALLLPDATVWVAGSNPPNNPFPNGFDPHVELYSPAYLFNATGGPAVRPRILTAPDKVGYGGNFQVQSDATDIRSVVLIRAGSDTHAFDFDQRMVELTFSSVAGTLTVTGPRDSNIAPPGYYMLFLLNQAGTPSVARFVQVTPHPTDQPPTAAITSPAADVSIRVGESVAFSGTASDPDGTIGSVQWVFPGGSPGVSNSLNAGSVTFNTAGDYVVSLTAVDDQGLNDPSPPTRNVHVTPPPGIKLTFIPESGSETNTGVVAGGTYRGTVVVHSLSGYSGTVALSCSQPQCTITPSTVTVAVDSTANANLAITTSVDESGAKQVTVRGSDRSDPSITGTVDVKYAVVNYSMSTSAGQVRINAGQTAHYTINASLSQTGVVPSFPAVTFSCSGLPQQSSCSFAPTSLTIDGGSGTTTLSIATTSTTVTTGTLYAPGSPREGSGSKPVAAWAFVPAVLGLIALTGAGAKRRRLKLGGLIVLLVIVAVFGFGCRGLTPNTSTNTHTSSQPGTPPGTYTVVVTGSAGQIQHSMNMTLTVN